MSLKGTTQAFTILRGEGDEAKLEAYELELDEGEWWCSTASIAFSTNKNPTWPSDGTAKPGNAALAPLKSTAGLV